VVSDHLNRPDRPDETENRPELPATAQFGDPGEVVTEPPRPGGRGPAVIVAIVVAALLVLGGIGTGIYLLVRPSGSTAGAGQSTDSAAPSGSSGPSGPSDSSPTGSPGTGVPPPAGPGPSVPESAPGGPAAPNTVAPPELKDVATRYVDAVNARNAAAATALTCDKQSTGSVYEISQDGGMLALGQQAQVFGSELGLLELTITLPDGSTGPGVLGLELKNNAWCVSL